MANRLSRQQLILGDGRWHRQEISSALVLITLPLLVLIRVTLFMRQRSSGDFTAVDTQAMLQSVMVALTFGILLVMPRTLAVLRKINGTSMLMILVFYAICALSAAWSKLPVYSLYRAVEVFVQMLAIWVGLSFFRTFASLERAALLLAFCALAFDFFGRVKLSGFGNLRTNTYAASAGMLFCYCFGEYFSATGKRRRRFLFYMIVSMLCVVLGRCSTSNVALVAGVLMVGLFKRGPVRIVTIFLMMLLVLLVLTGLHETLMDAAFSMLFPGKTRAQVSGMSGRVGMWAWALEKFSHQPITGYGFLVTGRLERNALTMHNVFIGSLLDTGLLGTTAIATAFIMAIAELLKRTRNISAGLIGCIGALSAGFVNCMGVPFLATHWTTATFAFSAIAGLYIHGVLRRPYPAYPMRRVRRGATQAQNNELPQEDFVSPADSTDR